MNILEYLKTGILYLDGGMGTLLQSAGLAPGELPERWNISHREKIIEIHKAYFKSGANVATANTFGANCLKYSSDELYQVISGAIGCAKKAAAECGGEKKWVALDIGPTGRMLEPYGDLGFEDAVSVFAETVRIGTECGADLILIETMNDSYETKAALLAAKENSSLPVFVSNAYGADGKLMTGADPLSMIAMLEGMGADAIGVNCSQGPRALMPVVRQYLKYSSLPVLVQPNAGLPRVENGKTVFDVSAHDFAKEVTEMLSSGVRIAGGCCGTTPEYIGELVRCSSDTAPKPLTDKGLSLVSAYTHAVCFGITPVLIGERINPTGKKRFKEALRSGNMDYIIREGLAEEERGAHILDVNVGLPEIDETQMLVSSVRELQAVTALPLQIDTSDPIAMEKALRIYNGKAMINSVNGKRESMDAVFPLAKKYGGLIVALTLDEQGIPETARGRAEIAKRIIAEAEKYGINKKDLIFDPLAMTVSADKDAALVTLEALDIIKNELGCLTSLGVSNVSFGLPMRDIVTSVFFASALERGLSAAIMNPYSDEMMKVYHAYKALHGMDESCSEYISFATDLSERLTAAAPAAGEAMPKKAAIDGGSELSNAIIKGMRESAAALTRQLILTDAPLDIVQNEIIPALNLVGEGFEKKTVYLPGLLMSAEAAKSAFEVIKEHMSDSAEKEKKLTIVLATVKGDIHDIGKNIVRLLLENYGYAVSDLGKDVPPEAVADETVRLHAAVVGLSALMTTTVPAMEETIKLLRVRAPWCRIMVGGAVLNEDYAKAIGADFYSPDAMGSVRYCEGLGS